jgi:large subunit ribosomal protein L15
MRLHDLTPAPGAHRERKRIGRGTGSGTGTTAGKGTKGEKARAGGLKAGFRGMSSRNFRLAKRKGFRNQFKVVHRPINVGDLARFETGSTIDAAALAAARMIDGEKTPVKILGDGELTAALTVVGLKVSASARQKIEAAGGSVQDTPAATEDSGDSGSV